MEDKDAFVKAGLPEDVADALCKEHKSDFSNPSAIVFNDGEPVKVKEGIYGLEFITELARSLGVRPVVASSRGMHYTKTARAIEQHIDKEKN